MFDKNVIFLVMGTMTIKPNSHIDFLFGDILIFHINIIVFSKGWQSNCKFTY